MTTTTKRRTTQHRPYVTSYEPAVQHGILLGIGNAFMRAILRTRLGERMQGLSILSFTGWKTGIRYDVPVAVIDPDGSPIVLTAARWRVNLGGGADVEVRAGRRIRPMRATLVEDPDRVVEVYERMLPIVGATHSKRLGLVLAGDRLPTHEELLEGIEGRRFLITLADR